MTTLNQERRTLRAKAIGLVNQSRVAATVNGHEAKTKPRHNNLHASVTLGRGRVAPDHSGLDATSWRQVVIVRLQHRLALAGGERAENLVEDRVADGTATLVQAFHDDIGLSDTIEFDPLGDAGLILETIPGYFTHEETPFRKEDIYLPFVIYDIWSQQR